VKNINWSVNWISETQPRTLWRKSHYQHFPEECIPKFAIKWTQ
jgi:hypothetical protein